MRTYLVLLSLGAAATCPVVSAAGKEKERRPNVVILFADDMGYADIGANGCKDFATPHIDSLAKKGVRFTDGYVTAPQCAPSRCGLLTGRYQQRFGFESNAERYDIGLPLTETTLASRLKQAGYATGMVGKWHLGRKDTEIPNSRGFDEFFGFLGGSNPYLPKAQGFVPNILRNREPVRETEYLTDAFGREAMAYVERHKHQPFFLYLAFNAPHGPAEATDKYLNRFPNLKPEMRRNYAAKVSAMDDAIGGVLAKLREHRLEEKTLIFFISDNGGPLGAPWNGSSNFPLRGQKGDTLEGGLRVPFLAQWKGTLPSGKVERRPVISLDVVPTVAAAVGMAPAAEWKLDGVNLLPYLSGKNRGLPHETLYWRFNFPFAQSNMHKWAVRQRDWKLVKEALREEPSGAFTGESAKRLYDLKRDPSEATDLLSAQPEKAKSLEALWQKWNAEMPPIMWQELNAQIRQERRADPNRPRRPRRRNPPPNALTVWG